MTSSFRIGTNKHHQELEEFTENLRARILTILDNASFTTCHVIQTKLLKMVNLERQTCSFEKKTLQPRTRVGLRRERIDGKKYKSLPSNSRVFKYGANTFIIEHKKMYKPLRTTGINKQLWGKKEKVINIEALDIMIENFVSKIKADFPCNSCDSCKPSDIDDLVDIETDNDDSSDNDINDAIIEARADFDRRMADLDASFEQFEEDRRRRAAEFDATMASFRQEIANDMAEMTARHRAERLELELSRPSPPSSPPTDYSPWL
jgi:hypothetical protein